VAGLDDALLDGRLRTPRAASVAGIVFGVLLATTFVLIAVALPRDPNAASSIDERRTAVTVAVLVAPLAGIAFLWFIGVVRDRVGELEDRFFSTVLIGSGLLFLAMTYVATGVAAALVATFDVQPEAIVDGGTYRFAREVMFRITNLFALRMAGVFMVAFATIGLRTRAFPRWLGLLTYVLAVVLLVVVTLNRWVLLVFPAWAVLVSAVILVTTFRRPAAP
jgi:hypothetical protein